MIRSLYLCLQNEYIFYTDRVINYEIMLPLAIDPAYLGPYDKRYVEWQTYTNLVIGDEAILGV